MKKASKILIIDDDLTAAHDGPNGNYMWYYTQALRDAGYRVVEVVGPDGALEILSSQHTDFDLVILDIMMRPGRVYGKEDTLNGLQTGVFLARTIEAQYHDLPIVVLTNVQNPETLAQLRQIANVKKTLCKPDCTPFELVEEIQQLWEHTHAKKTTEC